MHLYDDVLLHQYPTYEQHHFLYTVMKNHTRCVERIAQYLLYSQFLPDPYDRQTRKDVTARIQRQLHLFLQHLHLGGGDIYGYREKRTLRGYSASTNATGHMKSGVTAMNSS